MDSVGFARKVDIVQATWTQRTTVTWPEEKRKERRRRYQGVRLFLKFTAKGILERMPGSRHDDTVTTPLGSPDRERVLDHHPSMSMSAFLPSFYTQAGNQVDNSQQVASASLN